MTALRAVLENVARDLEPQVRSQLGGFFGGFVRAYLPQTWVFKSERETAVLSVDRAGTVTASEGPAPAPDVTVEAKLDLLVAVLSRRSRANLPAEAFRVTTHTPKGKTAFDYLRGRLGL